MSDRKFNTNDQQMMAEAIAIANTNAPQGTPTEFILAEAVKIFEQIKTCEMSELTKRVDQVKQLRLQKEADAEERRLNRLEEKDKEVVRDAIKVDSHGHPYGDTGNGDEGVIAPEGSDSLDDLVPVVDVEAMREQAIAEGVPDDVVVLKPVDDSEIDIAADPLGDDEDLYIAEPGPSQPTPGVKATSHADRAEEGV